MFLRVVLFCAVPVAAFAAPRNGEIDFNRQVRPILSDKCFLCHGPDKGTRMADLRLDVQEGVLAQRKNGHPVVPGKPDESLLIKRIYSEDAAFRMPPTFSNRTLTPEQKDTLRKWIEQGAKWNQHWAFVPPKKADAPLVKDATWPRNDIDRFILAKIEANGLSPAPETDRRTLIRRVTLDLTGLPPAPADVEAFVKDRSPRAYEKVVDRLLASPRYGEHRAHYWLDAARYADSNGLHFDNYREMWPYRDWVIRSFNSDMPFDRFTVEQLAGDLLPKPTLDQQIASGFQRCNVTTDEGGVILPEVDAMYAKDRADTMGTVWMGLTVGCATCHDHKFDPISTKDYYSLTSFFRNTTQTTMDLNVEDTPPAIFVPRQADRIRWEQLKAQREVLEAKLASDRHNALQTISAWLKNAQEAARSYEPARQVLGLEMRDRLTEVSSSGIQDVPLAPGVESVDAPEVGAKGLRFDKTGKLTLPSVPAIDSDKPFTLAAWIFIPDGKDDGTVVSQMENLPDGPKGEKRRRGWILRIDKGNLGIYDHAPTIYLYGDDGKGISGRPAPQHHFKPDSWYHLVIAYDGSGLDRGFSIYVNGAPVFVVGRPEDTAHLTSSTHTQVPITLAADGKQSFAGGGVADLRVLSGMADPEDVQLLYAAGRLKAASEKAPEQVSQKDAEALTGFYLNRLEPTAGQTEAQLKETDQALYGIKRQSATALVMHEREDTQPVAHVLYRGQYDQMRDEVHAQTPSVLPPMTQAMPRNRLGLAMWIVDPANPLTARVTVNRFWQEVFGTGLVKTVEDFGSQGEPPSHPELLDWLAVDFRDSGWDVKRFFKTVVMSATYRQSAATTQEKIAADPLNRLLAHGPRFRMDAEMVRDYALCASGLLSPEIGGPSAKPYQPSHIWDTVAMEQSNTRTYTQDTGENIYRRSLYTFWKRAAPPPSMDIFNAPSRETCSVRRERTNTPLQALVTMNDVQFVEAARVLAGNAMKAGGRLDHELDFMATRLLGRPLTRNETMLLEQSYDDFLAYYASTPDDAGKLLRVGDSPATAGLPKAKFAAMTMVANTMLNLDEVLTK